MAVSRRERTAVGLAVGVTLLVGVPGLLLDAGKGPKGRSLADERRKHREVTSRLNQVRRELDHLDGDVAKQVLPGTEQDLVPRIVQTAQTAARASGLRLREIKPLPAEDAAGLKRVAVQLSASAGFEEAARFLYELQRRNQRYSVDHFRITASGSSSTELQMELRVVAFVRGEEGEHAARS